MKKRIALLVAVLMVAVMILSMGTAMAAALDRTITVTYIDYNTGLEVTDFTLPHTLTIVDGQTIYFSSIPSAAYNMGTVISPSPAYITNIGGVLSASSLKGYVTSKNSGYYPYPTYYNYNGDMLTLGYGDYVYASIEAANPIPAIPAGTTYLITALNLGGLSPSNSHLTYSTSNSTYASVNGPLIVGNYPGPATLSVYYDGRLFITKSIIVTSSSYPTYTNSGSIVAADDNLTIGPANFSARKGKSYKFTNIKLNGASISATKLRWESSNTSIATVSKSGVVRTRKAGTVVITAETTDGENSASIDFLIN